MHTPPAICLACAALAVLAGSPADAHHGRAFYSDDIVTLDATVTEFRFVNPHVQIYFDITNASGALEHWQGELTAPNRLARGGWTQDTLKPGDRIRISGRAARNSGRSVAINEIIMPDGTPAPLGEVLD